MSPDPNAWTRAATALRQGAAFDQKLRKEVAAREAAASGAGASDPGTLGTIGLRRGVDPALMLRLAALAETQREQARTPAPGAPSAASSLRPMRGARRPQGDAHVSKDGQELSACGHPPIKSDQVGGRLFDTPAFAVLGRRLRMRVRKLHNLSG
jgi:hypothetical protein